MPQSEKTKRSESGRGHLDDLIVEFVPPVIVDED